MEKKMQHLPLSRTGDFSTHQFKAIPCIDWLQLNFRGTPKISPLFQTVTQPYSTRHFRNVIEIFSGKWRKATMVNQPLSSIIDPETNLIKLDNRELYYSNPVNRLCMLSASFNLFNYKPSRVDIAIDFNTFINNRNCSNFIGDYLKGKFTKIGHNNFTINGKEGDNFAFNYLRFSKSNSNVSTYLYNKSKELREVKKKNYIIEHWKHNNIDTSKDVWRLEFAIHNPKFKLLNTDTGEYEEFNVSKLDNKEYLKNVCYSLIAKYFDFRINNGTKVKKRMQKLKLFENFENIYQIQFMSESPDTNKADIQFLNKLKDLNNECREQSKHYEQATKDTMNYFKQTRKL